MNNVFKKYDMAAVKSTEIYIGELNKIFSEAGSDLKCLYRHEEKSEFAKMSSRCDENRPHMIIASEILGINIIDWKWNDNGYSVIITYRNN